MGHVQEWKVCCGRWLGRADAERIDRDGKEFGAQLREASQAQEESKYGPETVWTTLRAAHPENPAVAARYPLSFEKVMRMWRRLVRDQFVSFAEA